MGGECFAKKSGSVLKLGAVRCGYWKDGNMGRAKLDMGL